jgi:hypothetical protein
VILSKRYCTKARPSKRAFAPSPNSCARCARAAASRTITDHVPARDLAALLAAAHEASAALNRTHDELALQLIHATFNVDRHLSRDSGQPHRPAPTRQPDT